MCDKREKGIEYHLEANYFYILVDECEAVKKLLNKRKSEKKKLSEK